MCEWKEGIAWSLYNIEEKWRRDLTVMENSRSLDREKHLDMVGGCVTVVEI
jgi:hypothetical protein